MVSGERAPDRLPGAVVDQLRSEDPRDDDDRIPFAAVVARRAVVDLAQVGSLELHPHTASQRERCRHQKEDGNPGV